MVPPRRSVSDWLLLVIAVEKAVQHAFVTWAFAANRSDLREQVLPPREVLMVSGAVVAVLFGVAAFGVWRWWAWAPTLLVALALFDIGGEFVAQGTVMIDLVVSFIVAMVLLPLAWRARPRYEGYGG